MDRQTLVQIENNGSEIVSTNYYETDHARRGYVFLSINAGAFRLLVPAALSGHIPDMLTASEVIISRGPWPAQGRADGLEIMFEDHSESPFTFHIGTEQIDRMPAHSDRNKTFVFSVWTPDGKIKEWPGRYRTVKWIPFMKPWRKSH